jgi:hypothetical protein
MVHGFWNLAGPISRARFAHAEAAAAVAAGLGVADQTPR